jgi:hypothetical protein
VGKAGRPHSLPRQEYARPWGCRKEVRLKTASKVRILGVTGALVALAAVTAGGPASAGAKGEIGNTIKIKGDRHPHFVAPDEVVTGQDLQIKNLTRPRQIGPHTFSLVTKDALPKGRDELRKCALKGKLICGDIFEAHEVNFEAEEVGEPNVENGSEGWDTPFDSVNPGDSWFTLHKDETTARQVTAPSGAKLFFMCAIHPDMQGKVQVVDLSH